MWPHTHLHTHTRYARGGQRRVRDHAHLPGWRLPPRTQSVPPHGPPNRSRGTARALHHSGALEHAAAHACNSGPAPRCSSRRPWRDRHPPPISGSGRVVPPRPVLQRDITAAPPDQIADGRAPADRIAPSGHPGHGTRLPLLHRHTPLGRYPGRELPHLPTTYSPPGPTGDSREATPRPQRRPQPWRSPC